LEAMAMTKEAVRVSFAGSPDNPAYADQLKSLARKLSMHDRVKWLGQVSEEEKRDLYARSLGVIYPPIDEDFGYVTLEAMLAAKPVITCIDSGGPLEFVRDEETGAVAEASAESLAEKMDELWRQRERARQWGERGRELYREMKISWANVTRKILS
ncbi:MAG TPA: glycosyltransferase, partial [Pyrinomonadaceae bacterium]|nr:glycosyltransferase [Pyrinomonadaceae bacterium]